MSRKYNYIGFTSEVKKTKLPINNITSKEYNFLGLSFFCACGNVFKLNDNKKNTEKHIDFRLVDERMRKGTKNDTYCNKCKGKLQAKQTITLNSKLKDNVINTNYKVFTDGDLIKLVRFDDLIGVSSSGKKLYMTTNKSSICFNKRTKRFYYYRSYRKGNKVLSVGLRDISIYFSEFMRSMVLNQKVCFSEVNKVHIFKNIDKSYIKPFNEFLNILLQFIDKRDLDRLIYFLKPLRVSDLPTVNQLSLSLVSGSVQAPQKKDLTWPVIKNFELVISLIQYPNLSVLLFNLKKENYINLLNDSAPVSFFKKPKDLPQREIIKNIYIGKLNYYKQIKRNEFKYFYNNKEGLTYSSIKRKFSKILIPEHFSKYKIDMESIEDFALKNKMIPKGYRDVDFFSDLDNPCEFTYNALRELKVVEQASEYIKFVRKNKLPKYIVKDFTKSPQGSLIQICQTYYLMLYNEMFDDSEICLFVKKYELIPFFGMLAEYFNVVSYCDYFHYANSHEEAKENAVFVKHFMKVFFNGASNKESLLGEGYYRSNFIRIYKDTIEMLKDRDLGFESFLKCKTPVEIEEIHDYWSQIISLERMEKFNKGIKEFSKQYEDISEYSEDNIYFKLIDNINSLSEEGSTMRHCVKTYARGMAEGKYLIFSVKDLSTPERATLQFRARQEKNGTVSWKFEQLKGRFNCQSSQRLIDSIKLFVDNFLLKNNIKVNINYKEWDLVRREKKEHSLNERLIEVPDIYDMAEEEIDHMIEDVYLDDDLPF